MKKRVVVVAFSLAGFASLPAAAGPDWDVIHRAEARRAMPGHQAVPVLPLDHGPRALTTPWENEERLGKIEDQLKKKDAALAVHAHHGKSHS